MALFKFNDDSLLASVDAGSYSVRCAVFRKSDKFPLELLAFTEKRSQGLEESRIINFEDISLVFSEVLESAEELCKSSFSEVWLGFSPPFHSFLSQGLAALTNREVDKQDINLAVQTACAVPLPEGHIRLHSFPESFRVDDKEEVLNPFGLSGLRLETQARIITVPEFYCRGIAKSLKFLGCAPRAFFHNLAAFGQNLTSFSQKKNGICFCDIGYKSSRAVVYLEGKTADMFSIPFGGYHFSAALASQFNISLETAERLKESKGRLLLSAYDEGGSIEDSSESLYLSRRLFIETLEKAAEEFLEKIKARLTHKNLIDKISEGFLFTGGSAYMEGFTELASFYLGGRAFHPQERYDNFKKTNNLALIQQAYFEEKFKIKKQKFSLKWPGLKELF